MELSSFSTKRQSREDTIAAKYVQVDTHLMTEALHPYFSKGKLFPEILKGEIIVKLIKKDDPCECNA